MIFCAGNFAAKSQHHREVGFLFGYRHHLIQDLLVSPFIYAANGATCLVYFASESNGLLHHAETTYLTSHLVGLQHQRLFDFRLNYKVGFKSLPLLNRDRGSIYPLLLIANEVMIQPPENHVEASGTGISTISLGLLSSWNIGKNYLELNCFLAPGGYAVRSRYANARPVQGKLLNLQTLQRAELVLSHRIIGDRKVSFASRISLRHLRVEKPTDDLRYQNFSYDIGLIVFWQSNKK